jgi:uncharacterized phage-like protein YoqJ
MENQKICESCGMPMRSSEDFGGGRTDNVYCVYCTDQEGRLKPYDEVLKNMKNFAVKTMGVSDSEALQMAQEGMAKLPAWQNIQ